MPPKACLAAARKSGAQVRQTGWPGETDALIGPSIPAEWRLPRWGIGGAAFRTPFGGRWWQEADWGRGCPRRCNKLNLEVRCGRDRAQR